MFHSDPKCPVRQPSKSAAGQDTQYAAKEFRKELDATDFAQSFSVKGHPFDNMHR